MKINLSFLSLLTLLFMGLKLTSHIDWSWWWVLSPTLFQIGLGFLVLLIFFIASFCGAAIKVSKKK
jgi:hypothetical protein